MSVTTWNNKEELLELLHDNLLRDDEINSIVENDRIVKEIKRRMVETEKRCGYGVKPEDISRDYRTFQSIILTKLQNGDA